MVALVGLDQAIQVVGQVGPCGPRRAVDALEHRLAFVTPPVGAGHLLEGEVAQSAGGGHVGPGAQVDESVAVLVVADRAAGRDLTGQLVVVLPAGYPFDDLELVSVVGEQVLGLPGRRLMALEGLCLLYTSPSPRDS